jgi:hypothetical protein
MDKRPINFDTIRDAENNIEYLKISDADTGEEILRFLWDPTDEQTADKQKEFHEWAERLLRSKDML